MNIPQTAYLFCDTKRTRLWACPVDPADLAENKNSELEKHVLDLRNKDGRVVGSLHLHNEEQREMFPKTMWDGEQGKEVEVVAIYKTRVWSKMWDKKWRGGEVQSRLRIMP